MLESMGYSNERHIYCKQLNYDILTLTEPHNEHVKEQYESKGWITSDMVEVKGDKCTDPAACVTIMLSAKMTNKILSSGHIGARITWVRLSDPVYNLFVVANYIHTA